MPSLITKTETGLNVADQPIIPYIQGDGIGPDIWKVTQKVVDEAVSSAYGTDRAIDWKPILAGQAAFDQTGEWLPTETVETIRSHLVAIKGPLTTPVGGGIRSLNVALRQLLDLFACVRPVRWFEGVPSPVKNPAAVDMVIFRENTEDVYAGMELEANTPEARQLIGFLAENYGWEIRPDSGIGIKPISMTGTNRLVRAAISYALAQARRSVTLVHKGNIMKFTEGAFQQWGYQLASQEFGTQTVSWEECGGDPGERLLIQDVIADAFLQQVLTRPRQYDVIATSNLNGDYISDALAAQVGGIGMAPGANINYETGHALFEATHGTAPKYANQDKVNPSSLILSAEMMLRYLGWNEAADRIIAGLQSTISEGIVTYDLARLRSGAKEVPTSGYGQAIIDRM